MGSHLLQHCHQAGLHLRHMHMHLRRRMQANNFPFTATVVMFAMFAVETKPIQTVWPPGWS